MSKSKLLFDDLVSDEERSMEIGKGRWNPCDFI